MGAVSMSALVTALRLVFGALLIINGLSHLIGPFYPEPAGSEPLAIQLMVALQRSRLLDVATGFELVAGVMLAAGVLVPFALCLAMPISVCALFWSLILEHDPLWSTIAALALAANAGLMFAHLGAYRGVLQPRALAAGEGAKPAQNFDGLFMNLAARTPPAPFIAGLLVLLAAFAFYWFLVPSVTGRYAMLTMAVPAILLVTGAVRGVRKRT